MALPVRPPAGGLPVARPPQVLPALPSVTPPKAATPPPAPRQVTPPPQVPKTAPKPQLPEGWVIDKATGKPHKLMPGFKKGVMDSKTAVTNAAKRGFSLEQLRMAVEDEPDFSLDNLNASADTFLAHLRVPPDKEEIAKLRAERLEREKLYAAMAAEAAAQEEKDFE